MMLPGAPVTVIAITAAREGSIRATFVADSD
jgi:hypothetical protein